MAETLQPSTNDAIDDEIQQLINHSFGIAEEQLIEVGSYHPFGLTLNDKGEVIPFTFELEEGAEVDFDQLIDELDTVLFNMLEAKEIKAYGVGYQVQIEINEKGDLSNALLVDLTHQEDDKVPFYFFPYSRENGEVTFGDSFGIEK